MYNQTNYDMTNYVLDTIDAFFQEGHRPGDFVKAVLSNDLKGAIFRADLHNLAQLKQIMLYIHNECPDMYDDDKYSYGSPEKYEAFLEYKRLEKEAVA